MIYKTIALSAIAVVIVLGVGGSVLSASKVDAATDTTATTQQAPVQQNGSFDPSKGGHVGVNGTKEVLLTGDTAQKATDAAKAAVFGGTVERVETDAEGAAYEAHMTKSDGSHMTVKMDSNFKVTSTEDGFGGKK
jgi:hypothetical protein